MTSPSEKEVNYVLAPARWGLWSMFGIGLLTGLVAGSLWTLRGAREKDPAAPCPPTGFEMPAEEAHRCPCKEPRVLQRVPGTRDPDARYHCDFPRVQKQ